MLLLNILGRNVPFLETGGMLKHKRQDLDLGPLLVFSVLFARGGLYRFLVGQRDDE